MKYVFKRLIHQTFQFSLEPQKYLILMSDETNASNNSPSSLKEIHEEIRKLLEYKSVQERKVAVQEQVVQEVVQEQQNINDEIQKLLDYKSVQERKQVDQIKKQFQQVYQRIKYPQRRTRLSAGALNGLARTLQPIVQSRHDQRETDKAKQMYLASGEYITIDESLRNSIQPRRRSRSRSRSRNRSRSKRSRRSRSRTERK
jgi:hypothetical protein